MSIRNSSNFSLERLLCRAIFIGAVMSAFALLQPTIAYAESPESTASKDVAGKNWLRPFDAESSDDTAFCRLGVNLSTLRSDETGRIESYDVSSLGIGWYIDYQATHVPVRPNNVDYAPMVRILPTGDISGTYSYSPNGANLWIAITNNLGADWFIGNEPDRKAFQDGAEPEIYAKAYNEIYYKIKNVDPTAKIFAGSIVQPTQVRLTYLDEVLASYEEQFGEPMPVDGWSIHNFILNEADCAAFNDDLNQCWGADMPPGSTETEGLRINFTPEEIVKHHDIDIFKTQLINFRQWMADNGYRGLPVYLSEYGVLLPNIYANIDFSPAVVNQFMTETFDFMLSATDPALGDPNDGHKLIQRFSWYSVNDDRDNGGQYNGNLFDTQTFAESEMGRNYREYAENLPKVVDVYVADIEFVPAVTVGTTTVETAPITHTVRMTVANRGNLLEPRTAYLTLSDSNGELIEEDIEVELAGCGDHVVIETEWVIAPVEAAQILSTISYGKNSIFMPIVQK